MRVFIAVELSKEAKEELSRVIDVLRSSGADAKWVRPEAMHLTLKFLGDVSENSVEKIKPLLQEIARKTGPFDLILDGIGVFPDWRNVKVIWAGISEGADKAEILAKAVEGAMAGIGFEKETRPFRPHLTLGRIKGARKKDELKKAAQGLAVKTAKSFVSEIVMFRSDLTSEGAIHTPLASFKLAG